MDPFHIPSSSVDRDKTFDSCRYFSPLPSLLADCERGLAQPRERRKWPLPPHLQPLWFHNHPEPRCSADSDNLIHTYRRYWSLDNFKQFIALTYYQHRIFWQNLQLKLHAWGGAMEWKRVYCFSDCLLFSTAKSELMIQMINMSCAN